MQRNIAEEVSRYKSRSQSEDLEYDGEEEQQSDDLEDLEDELDDDVEIALLAGEVDLAVLEDFKSSKTDEEMPIIELPVNKAVLADRDAATRMMLIENTEHTVKCD